MELIIVANLHQAKEVLYFYTHFLQKNFLFTCPAEVVLRSLHINKTSAAKNSEVPGHSQEPLSERGSERLNPTSSGCIRFSHHIEVDGSDFTRPSCQHRLRPRRSSNAASSPRTTRCIDCTCIATTSPDRPLG